MDVPTKGESDRAFEPHELEVLFQSPAFTGCLRDNRPFDKGSFLRRDWRFWTPLIACLTGARISEIVQLTPKDIYQDDGVWVFDFNDDDGKRLKTNSSRRTVPIHLELIRIGLLKYADERRALGAPSLLGITVPKNGNSGHVPGNWLREHFLTNVFGTKRPGTGWHSFRHSMENRLRKAGVRDDIGNRLTGHATPGVAVTYGGFDLKNLKSDLEKLDVPSSIKAIVPRYPSPQTP